MQRGKAFTNSVKGKSQEAACLTAMISNLGRRDFFATGRGTAYVWLLGFVPPSVLSWLFFFLAVRKLNSRHSSKAALRRSAIIAAVTSSGWYRLITGSTS